MISWLPDGRRHNLCAQIARMDARTPALGAQVVARAWVDPGFKARLLADGSAACLEMGHDIELMKLVAVENTERVHNVVVCTLCSCYPRNLLGLPPDWYKRGYRLSWSILVTGFNSLFATAC